MHEKVLILVHKDNNASFEELLGKDNSVTVNYKNHELIATEISEVIIILSSDIMIYPAIFYNLRSGANSPFFHEM